MLRMSVASHCLFQVLTKYPYLLKNPGVSTGVQFYTAERLDQKSMPPSSMIVAIQVCDRDDVSVRALVQLIAL